MDKVNKFRLIGKIKGLSEEVRRVRNTPIVKSDGNGYRTALWWNQRIKLSLRDDTRHHLLAYAFIKNRPYKDVERKCAVKPNANVLVTLIQQHGPVSRLHPTKSGVTLVSNFSDEKLLELVNKWLNGEV